MKKYIAGIDVGTTGTKAMIFDFDGNVMGTAYREYGCSYPHPGWVEVNGEDLINYTLETCKEAAQVSGVNSEDIVSAGFSTQRATFGMVDENDKLINNTFYSWQDNRATDSVDFELTKLSEDEIFRISGMPAKTTFSVSKLIWLKNHLPDVYNRAKKMVLVQDFLLKKLGANDYYIDWGSACCTGLFDFANNKWSKKLISAFELDESLLPKLVPPASKVGIVSDKASKLSGFSEGMTLCVGTGDQQCGVVGAGAVKQGLGTLTIGTAGFLISFLDKPITEPKFKSMLSVGAGVPGKFEIEGFMLGAASIYRWLRDNFCELDKKIAEETGEDSYNVMENYVKDTTVGAKGLVMLPYLGGAGCPFWNVEASGVLAGMTFAHSKADVARAFMEGEILEIRNIYENMKIAGVKFDEIIITGGATKSPTWRQIIADIMNIRIRRLLVSDATVLGAAILGATGAGYFDSVEQGTSKMVKYGEVVYPIKINAKKYDEIFKIYLDLYHALDKADVFSSLLKI